VIFKSYEILKKKIDNFCLFLFYGENEGLKKDLIESIINKNNNKQKIHKFEESEILNNPDNIYNLIFSGSFFETFKICYINKISDKSLPFITDIMKKKPSDIIIFCLSGNLEKKSKIRNLFEKEKGLICVPCYSDTQIDLNRIINNELKNLNIKLSQEAINLIITRVNGDRQNLKNEINKIKNYSLNKKTISFEEVKILTNLASNFENDEIVNFSLSGEKVRLKRMMEENNFSSVDSFILQKILNKKIHRLIKIKILQQKEKNADTVINQIKPPIFWKEKEIVKKQAIIWSLNNLYKVIDKLNNIELSAKKNYEIGINITLDFLAYLCNEANNSSL